MHGKILFLVTLLLVVYVAMGQRYFIISHPHVPAAPIYHVPAPFTYRSVYRTPVVYYGDGFDSIDGFNT